MKKFSLSVVIPAYNEAKKVRNTFVRLDRFFSKHEYVMEYIFVEDGSKDATLAVLKDLAKDRSDVRILVNKRNKGKGFSIRRGMLEAKGDYILFIDADMSTPLQAFNEFRKYLSDFDIVIGSRWLEASNIRIQQPWYRRSMGVVFYIIIRSFFLKGITDTNCGFKCYRKKAARDIFSRQLLRGWGFDAELLYIAQKHNYRIKEVPVKWAHGRGSKVNFFLVPLLTLLELLQIKINDRKRCYGK